MARIDDYRESFRIASEELQKLDVRQRARAAGADLLSFGDGSAGMRLHFLGELYLVRLGDGVSISKEGKDDEVPLQEKVLLSHYLLHVTDTPSSGTPITYRQVPDGHFYFEAFQRRTRDPFLSTFGDKPELFLRCARELGGIQTTAGDAGATFQVLPRISVQLVLWAGDDEFPPEANILFEDGIQQSLSAEDIAVMTGMLVYRLMGIARRHQSEK
ncbi:MAG: DUF3786 domain-containing protein [Syntrophobacteraceae bacterium]|nr:DUF3786 domain-containing protein [Desulfobacteraceae bacterium]